MAEEESSSEDSLDYSSGDSDEDVAHDEYGRRISKIFEACTNHDPKSLQAKPSWMSYHHTTNSTKQNKKFLLTRTTMDVALRNQQIQRVNRRPHHVLIINKPPETISKKNYNILRITSMNFSDLESAIKLKNSVKLKKIKRLLLTKNNNLSYFEFFTLTPEGVETLHPLEIKWLKEKNDPENKKKWRFINQELHSLEGILDDTVSGFGKLITPNGDFYIGDIVNSQPKNGLIIPHNYFSWYEGEFCDGKYSGSGKYQSKSGELYEGEYYYGEKNGNGCLKIQNHLIFDGIFLGNHFQYGELYLPTLDTRYTGPFISGTFHGKGEYVTKKYQYSGDFVKGQRAGMGKLVYPTNEYYEGSFQGDAIHGEGSYHFQNGDRFVGSFEKNSPNGKGTHYFENDSVCGIFSNGVLISMLNVPRLPDSW